MSYTSSMPDVPKLETPRLILRELVESDAAAYKKYFDNFEVIRQLTASVPWPYPEDGVIDYIRKDILPHQGKTQWVWAITMKQDPSHLIGAIELLRKAAPTNRGFWLGQPFWGNGYMTEAVSAVTDCAFKVLGFEKLLYGNAVGNSRSRRIKEKAGARFVRREPAKYVDPSLTEREIFEQRKEEWLAQK